MVSPYSINPFLVAQAIQENCPTAKIVFNMVPKKFAMNDIYCQLIHNSDDQNQYYDMVPRMGAFEISINGVLIFSKSLSGIWPNYVAIGEKAKAIGEAMAKGQDILGFQTSGKPGKVQKEKGPKIEVAAEEAPAQAAP